MTITAVAPTTNPFMSTPSFAEPLDQSPIALPAYIQLSTFTVTVSGAGTSDDPWKISGVEPIVLPYGSAEVGTGTVYGMKFVLDAPTGVTAIFQTPAITFQTADTPAFNIAPYGTDEATIIWANTVPVETPQTFDYTINALINGIPVTHDPTVENLPPSTP